MVQARDHLVSAIGIDWVARIVLDRAQLRRWPGRRIVIVPALCQVPQARQLHSVVPCVIDNVRCARWPQ
eukprot:SAG22_NODE_11100_length_501_cov_1.037313_1_plen_68_part_10